MNRTYLFETEIFCNINVFLVTFDEFNAFLSEKRMVVVYFYISARYTKTMIVLIIFIKCKNPFSGYSDLFVQAEFVQFRKNPAHAPISTTHQGTKGLKLLEKTKPVCTNKNIKQQIWFRVQIHFASKIVC